MNLFKAWMENPSQANSEALCTFAGERLTEILSEPEKMITACYYGSDFWEVSE